MYSRVYHILDISLFLVNTMKSLLCDVGCLLRAHRKPMLILLNWTGGCQLPLRETHSGGWPWTPPNHWPSEAFWLIISRSLDSVRWPRMSPRCCVCRSVCVSRSLSFHGQFNKRKRKYTISLKHLGSTVQWKEGSRFFNDDTLIWIPSSF